MIPTKMDRKTILYVAALLMLFSLAPHYTPASNQPQKKTIVIGNQASVDGIVLTPGNYEILIEGNKVTFESEGKTIVTAACSWKKLEEKSSFDVVVVSIDNVVQEIDFAGSNQALVVM